MSADDNAFADLPNLEQISLTGNRLDHLRKEWFTNTSNIKKFSFDRNFIKKNSTGHVSRLEKLDNNKFQ